MHRAEKLEVFLITVLSIAIYVYILYDLKLNTNSNFCLSKSIWRLIDIDQWNCKLFFGFI